MKILLVLWAIGLARCDKLDRTYLPSRSSISAGGYPEDLNLPLEFPNENLPSTSKLGSNGTTDNSLSSRYPNIALGIDREGPFVTSPPKFTKGPENFVSESIYNIPNTNKPYKLTEKSKFVPVEVFVPTVGPVTTVPQRYSSTSSSFDPNLTYDQYLIQENTKANKAPHIIPNYISPGSVTNIPNKNTGVLSGASDIKAVNDQGDSFSYGRDLDSISKVVIPNINTSYFDKNLNQPAFNTFSTQRVPFHSDDINTNSQIKYDPIKTELSSTLTPDETILGKSATNGAPKSKYGFNPISSNNFDTSYKTMFPPQRVQAEDDRNAVILNNENILTPEGFAYSFDTSNGIHADESGTANNGVQAKGSYSFTGDDGKIYTIEYTADENGFLPRGNHLPTAPPIPDTILKNIEIAEQNRNLGIIEDGSYDNTKYGHHKYQGLMDRIPQNQYNNFMTQANFKQSKTNNLGNKRPAYTSNTKNGQNYNKISSTSEPGISSYSPHKSETIEDGDDKTSPSFYYTNRSDENGSFNPEGQNFNNEPITERNKFRENTITSAPIVDEELEIHQKKFEILNPGDVDNVLPKAYKVQNDYHSGYVYTLPQNMFNDRDQDKLHLNIPGIRRNYGIIPDDEKRDEFSGANTLFDYQKQRPVTSSPELGKSFNNYYVTASEVNNNGVNNPDLPLFSNKEFDRIRNEQIINPERVYPSTLKPTFVTTTKEPYNYKSPYAFGEIGKQSTYPSSTYGSEYSQSTTPVPSDVSSPITPSTSIYRYSTPSTSSVKFSVTTPTISQISSTLSPSISSRRPTSNISSGPSSYTGSISEPEEVDSGTSTTRPNQFGQRIIGRPENDSRRNKIPITKTGFSEDVEHGFVKLADPSSQDLGLSSIPENVNTQSSTERLIGEDFNGPKQPQRFDPKHGYYY